jgi:hypothetical protein
MFYDTVQYLFVITHCFFNQDILKKYRWDMPPDIEKNQADWDKVVTAVQYQLTQTRSKFKKEVRFENLVLSRAC